MRGTGPNCLELLSFGVSEISSPLTTAMARDYGGGFSALSFFFRAGALSRVRQMSLVSSAADDLFTPEKPALSGTQSTNQENCAHIAAGPLSNMGLEGCRRER